MEDNPAAGPRDLMDVTTFQNNFGDIWANQTYLCHEVEVWEGDTWVPVEQYRDYLHNQGADLPWKPGRHAEVCFLDRVRSWPLDRGEHYRITCYISWSPCPDCALELVAFLRDNSHVSLRIFAARVYTRPGGYELGLRILRDAVAQLSIMTPQEHAHCWQTFVDSRGQPFEPWPHMDEHIGAHRQKLETIL